MAHRVVRPQNLAEPFRIATLEYRQKPVHLTNNQQAARLYRHSLKTLCAWAIDRDIFCDEAEILRARFDANRGLPPAQAIAMIEKGEDELFKYTHPDPYVRPYMPGGSGFMRSSPLPKEICFPDGDAPADFPDYFFNPDMTISKPETGKSAVGSVLIDWPTKKML